jgi:hypothetical protein
MQQCVKPEQVLTICPSLDRLDRLVNLRQFSTRSSSSPWNLEAVDAAYDSPCGPLVSVTRVPLGPLPGASEVGNLEKKSSVVRVDRDTWMMAK